ncbi:hypothetical protein RvY_06537 [Ramazzottius varieornatus]|uniref:Uncharacterized protein n=1 Tax=Ramazzottius varieornatus TaxID=947166 RepID=A0A1D1UYY9_RAMVA|nr:hypothetical protein RvY_06537 [Ramazzottius varieornatus]
MASASDVPIYELNKERVVHGTDKSRYIALDAPVGITMVYSLWKAFTLLLPAPVHQQSSGHRCPDGSGVTALLNVVD